MHSDSFDEAQIRDLIAKAQQGDTDAFGTVYDHFFDSVYRYVTFRLPEEVAEDLTAEIFVKAWEKLHTYHVRKKVPFGAWLFRIARYSVIDTYRKQKQTEEVPEEVEDTDILNRAETRVKRKHLLKIIRSSMDQLPTKYKEVLQLSYIADLPYAEVARVLRTTEGSVRIMKHRALKKLEEILPADLQENV